jgi:hypothetical protein
LPSDWNASSASHFSSERPDFVRCFEVEEGIQTGLGASTVSLNLVDLVCLELSEDVSQVVDAPFIEGL